MGAPYPVVKREDGYEVALIPPEDRVRWIGVPVRLSAAHWRPELPELVAGMPGRMSAVEDAKLRAELEWLAQWSKADPERVVVLTGPQGRGKSMYAAATIRRALSAHPRPVWASWPRLVADVTASWTSREVSERQILDRYVAAGFLVVDDFGKELTGVGDDFRLRDWQRRIAFELVNGRYERRLPVLITTELDLQTMSERLDASIASRLKHEGRWIDLSALPDFRLRGPVNEEEGDDPW